MNFKICVTANQLKTTMCYFMDKNYHIRYNK
nr:MAG TPA: hypothetical protein [Caudoviricetes sp.]